MKSSSQIGRKNGIVAKVDIRKLKSGFSHKFPNSVILTFVQKLPDEIDPSELVGEALILLKILDMAEDNLFISSMSNKKEGKDEKT